MSALNIKGLVPENLTQDGFKVILVAAIELKNPPLANKQQILDFIQGTNLFTNGIEPTSGLSVFGKDAHGPFTVGHALDAGAKLMATNIKEQTKLAAFGFELAASNAAAISSGKEAQYKMDSAAWAAKAGKVAVSAEMMKQSMETAIMGWASSDAEWSEYLLGQVAAFDEAIGAAKAAKIEYLSDFSSSGKAQLLIGLLGGVASDSISWFNATAENFSAALAALIPDSFPDSFIDLGASTQPGAAPGQTAANTPNVGPYEKCGGGDPVLTGTGDLWIDTTDLSIDARGLSWNLRRTYSSSRLGMGILGRGWTMPLVESFALFAQVGGVASDLPVVNISWGDGAVSKFILDPDNHSIWLGVDGEFGKAAYRFMGKRSGNCGRASWYPDLRC
jgi:hypothetical protein